MQKTRAKILVVEDERSMREILTMLLESEGFSVVAASDGQEGISWLERDIFDLVITDIKMPGIDGFGVLAKTQELSPETSVIMMTAFGTMESALEAMKLGAYDYIHKPFKIDEIRLIVENALDRKRLKTEVSLLRETVKSTFEVENIIGKSPKMQELLSLLPKVAANSSNVLITGESGTGKELVANALHNLSPRAPQNFVAINCASFPEGLLESEIFGHMKGSFTGATQNKQGLFEVANGGTLFLDEIAEMPHNLQSKLLRAIETSTFRRVGGTSDIKVDVRIVSATNKDLKEECPRGNFREDLYYRLNVIPLHIPPLRERKDDIPLLVDHFMKKYSGRSRQFSGSAMSILMDYEWKGNVRELENMIERTLLFTDKDLITASELPSELAATPQRTAMLPSVDQGTVDLEEILKNIEKNYLLEALTMTAGKKTEAAKLLNLSFRSFRHKLSKYGIK
jgi:two-component system response regulator PilR (NtrC family)